MNAHSSYGRPLTPLLISEQSLSPEALVAAFHASKLQVFGIRSWKGGEVVKLVATRKPKNMKVVEQHESLVQQSKFSCDQLAESIRDAHNTLDPGLAVKTIANIWECVERVGRLAEARTRISLAKIKFPGIVPQPPWLEMQWQKLNECEIDGLPNAMATESADLLIRACLDATKTEFTADIQPAPFGGVFVNWNVDPHVIQWEVEQPRLAWPGAKVNVLVIKNVASKPETHARLFHTAFEVIEHFNEQLNEFGVQARVH